MCGIAGIAALAPVTPATVAAMTATMVHRGPDGHGLWSSPDGRVVLGHRRLAIIDTSAAGAQPMASADGTRVLCFNGEIYNYREVAARLTAEGATFSGHSDTEVLLAAYGRWGEDCLAELNGMFAFALWDGARNRLFCARDRFGEKPFLFATPPGAFVFASEYKALLTVAEIGDDVDMSLLARFLVTSADGLDDRRQTVFPAISQLLPGECLTLDLDNPVPVIRRYWTLTPGAPLTGSETEVFARFGEVLEDSVRLRLRSDVPVGSCLSGGLDSSAIVCLARKLRGDGDYHVFTGRFPGSEADEWPYAEQVVAATAATAHVVTPDPARLVAELPHFIWHNELPVGSSSQYAQYCVFRLAAEHGVTVLLDGQGADEILGGYEQYFMPYLAARRAAGLDVREEEEAIRARYPAALFSRAMTMKRAMPVWLKRLLADLGGRGSDVALGLAAGLDISAAEHAAPPDLDALRQALHRDSFHTHLPTLLRYGDRNSMAHSREVRLPFCDHRVAELAFTLPPHLLMGETQTKRLIRESLRGILPEAIRCRWNKRGFRPPQEQWLAGPMLPAMRETLESPEFTGRGLWRVKWWRSVLDRFQSGESGLAWVLWRPFVTEAWFRHFLAPLRATPRLSWRKDAA